MPQANLVGVPKGEGYSGITMESCAQRIHYETPEGFVMGYLIPSERSLYMTIKLANLPRYCARAHTDASTDLF